MWKDLISHLASQGHSQYAMAKAAGVDQSTISRIAAGGTDPRWSVAQALISLGGGLDHLVQAGVITIPMASNDPQAPQRAEQGTV